MGWKAFNDRLAFLGFLRHPWTLGAESLVSDAPEALGATIAVWALIAQYYFRKAPNGTP